MVFVNSNFAIYVVDIFFQFLISYSIKSTNFLDEKIKSQNFIHFGQLLISFKSISL